MRLRLAPALAAALSFVMAGGAFAAGGAVTAADGAAAGADAAPAAGGPADAAPETNARFAIIVGVNDSVDADARPLRYADDDAAAYLELFRALGARTYLLSRFDEGTRRLHPQAAAEAQDPRGRELGRVVEQAAADVARARERGLPTVVYFVYAGHGRVDGGRGYLSLEDTRLFGADLEQLIVDRIGAGETHFIVDACYSAFLAFSRGPGGERREAHGFATAGGLAARSGVGLLLSTSSARESHEWSEFQAGVFSHEVRSGLLGAADANGDGRITYREISAFIERANAPIANERLRPDVFAKEPSPAAPLLDLRPGLGRRLELDGDHPGHYFIEDGRGVRVADFHNAPGQPLRLIRFAGGGPSYLRQVAAAASGDDVEYVMDAAPAVLRFADLRRQPAAAQPRGAATDQFRLLFSLPFSQAVVDDFVDRPADVAVAAAGERTPRRSLRRPLALGLAAAGAVAAAAGTWALVSAQDARTASSPSQAQIFETNQLIERRNDSARVLYGLSGAALAGAAVLWLWPSGDGASSPAVTLGLAGGAEGGALLQYRGRF
jgi:hypothetical protein